MKKITSFKTSNGTNAVKIENIGKISIFKTFDCGQCFRFDPVSVFGNKYEFGGVAFGRYVIFAQNCENEIIIYNSTKDDYENIWENYLSVETDYEKINENIINATKSKDMENAVKYGDGIRILRQDGWECICSFIISQNNNIPRIKKIITALSEKYGDSFEDSFGVHYSFPTAKSLFEAGENEIFALKTGFRAKYIIDASEKIYKNCVSIDRLKNEADFQKCLELLESIKGIGLKVASCALLFGFGKTEAFPVDVWMKRALEKYFPDGIDLKSLGKCAGIAQQYLFYYEKYNNG